MIQIIADGLFTVLEQLNVKQVIIGKQFEDNENLKTFTRIINKKHIPVKIAEIGEKIYIEKNLYFDVLWPDSNNQILDNSINNNALVLKLNYNIDGKNSNFSMLFTGDIEEEAENILMLKYKDTNILKSTVLKVGHHGSKSSSTKKFLDLVLPKIALIGVGEKNTFGHPNNGVIERLENLESSIYRTDENGEISIYINNKGKIQIEKIME